LEKISYTKSKFVTETKEIEIEDIKNVYLEGRNGSNRACYLGIWINSQGLREVTITDGNIHFSYSLSFTTGTGIAIKNFMENHNAVKTISKEAFFNKLNNIKAILEA